MKITKNIVLGVLALIIILGIIAYFLPSKVTIQKSITIKASKEVVFEQINNPQNWEKWSPWFKIDTAMEVKYIGNKIGENSGIVWKSENSRIGCGRLTLLYSNPFDSIYAEVEALYKGKGTVNYIFKRVKGGINVLLMFEMNLGTNPIARFMGLVIDKKMSKNYINELDSLKKFTETLPLPYKYKIEEIQSKGFNYIGIRKKVRPLEIGVKMGTIINDLMGIMNKNKLKTSNNPFSIYFSVTKDSIDFETGFPIEENNIVSKSLHVGQMKESKAVVLDFYGPYNEIEKGYSEINNWISDNNKKITGVPYEIYYTNPAIEKDSSKWLTRIIYPIE